MTKEIINKEFHENNQCPKCENIPVLVKAYVSEWEADQEPYAGNREEDHEGISEEAYFYAHYCEQCNEFVDIWCEDTPIIEKEATVKPNIDLEKELFEDDNALYDWCCMQICGSLNHSYTNESGGSEGCYGCNKQDKMFIDNARKILGEKDNIEHIKQLIAKAEAKAKADERGKMLTFVGKLNKTVNNMERDKVDIEDIAADKGYAMACRHIMKALQE